MEKIAQISVVIPHYNGQETILRAVDSVWMQSLKPLELIIVDDKSNIENLKYLYELKNKYKYGWLKIIESSINKGPGAMRNIGWESSIGEYVAFLDADDAWHIQKLEIQIKIFEADKKINILGHETSVFNREIINFKYNTEFQVRKINKYLILFSNPLALRTVMVKKNFEIRFDSKKRYMEDYDWLLKVNCEGVSIHKFNEKLSFTFKRDWGQSGLSSHLLKMQKNELDNYFQLYENKKINLLILCVVVLFSTLKFIRRIIINKFLKLAKI